MGHSPAISPYSLPITLPGRKVRIIGDVSAYGRPISLRLVLRGSCTGSYETLFIDQCSPLWCTANLPRSKLLLKIFRRSSHRKWRAVERWTSSMDIVYAHHGTEPRSLILATVHYQYPLSALTCRRPILTLSMLLCVERYELLKVKWKHRMTNAIFFLLTSK